MLHAREKSTVLCIGRIYCDLIFTGLNEMPVLGREVFADNMEIAAGGGAFITAAHTARLGRPAGLVARLGTDALSSIVSEKMNRSGVDLSFVEYAAEAGPQVTVASVIGHDRAFLTRRAGPVLPDTLEAALRWEEATHLHIAEYATLHEVPDLIKRAKANGLTVSLDPSWDAALIYDENLLKSCAGVDVFLPNLEEARAITGRDDPEIALRTLADHFPCIALKAGHMGAWAMGDNKIHYAQAERVPVVDTTGAGDAFNAGFLNSWIGGKGLEEALAGGIRTGSIAVQVHGGTVPAG